VNSISNTKDPFHRHTGWTTEDEIAFVDRLASGHGTAAVSGYVDAMTRRVSFGAIDAEVVTEHAQQLVASGVAK
jgi:hypothetical protein